MGQIARFPGRCSKCDRKIIRDRDLIEKNTYGQWVHVDCPNWNRSQVSKNNSPPKTTEIKNEEDHFHGFHLKSESRGSAIFDDLDYEKTDFIKMSHDYHENHNDYDYVLCKVPIQHQLLNCKTNRPASINHIAEKLLIKLDRIRSFERPIVFGIIGKGSGKTKEKASKTVLKVIGKINRRTSHRASGFGSSFEYFFEDICWFVGSNTGKQYEMLLNDDDSNVMASRKVAYFYNKITSYDFLKLFSKFELNHYPDEAKRHFSSIQKHPTANPWAQKESIVDEIGKQGKSPEELGFIEESKEEEQMESNLDEDEYDPDQREKETLKEPIRKLSPELEKKIEECKNDLSLDDKYIRQIIHHLASGRHVLIGGAIGTGKSHFVRKFLGKFWATEKSPEGYKVEIFTATDEWSTVDVIGGLMPDTGREDLRYKFQDGCLTKKVKDCTESLMFPKDGYQGDWLAIDEFNRADIEKAFGQLFTAIDTEELKIPGRRVGEQHVLKEDITIPKQFRIIGMMNTSDKHHLYQIHDALKRRFAYVEIEPPTRADRDNEIELATKNANSRDDAGQDNATPKIVQHTNIAYEMLAAIRTAKGLGTAILKVIIQELISAANADQIYITQTGNEVENNLDTVLDWSLTANLLPQFQGVNKKTLEMFEKIFIDNTGSPIDFFEEVNKDPSQLSEYSEAWKMFVRFVRNTDDVSEEELDLKKQRTQIGRFSQEWDERSSQIKFNSQQGKGSFAKNLRKLIESEDY